MYHEMRNSGLQFKVNLINFEFVGLMSIKFLNNIQYIYLK